MILPYLSPAYEPHEEQYAYSSLDIRIYAVGDIHGHCFCLDKMLLLISEHLRKFPTEHYQLIFLGDYVDRGLYSRQVINRLISLQDVVDAVCIMGNHEFALLQFLDGIMPYDTYVRWGGDTTLQSYNVKPWNKKKKERKKSHIRLELLDAMPQDHITFLRNLPFYYKIGDYIFVHAGLKPGVPLDKQSTDDMMMIRDEFLSEPVTCEQRIIHGHTIFKNPYIRERSIGVDTGAYKTNKLTAIMIENNDYSFMTARYKKK